ncbi:hypothetical protein RU07_17220 [Agrobacterium tumefaciens]|uniref:YjiS-like domain-containing protein n=1 Tax=Agrobacterium tumefaciens TaxID=358 RepID=A0A0D0KQI2_AGRTU|nr:hypothetical protein RU07_17220 [Agrobacterium tumefaciens]
MCLIGQRRGAYIKPIETTLEPKQGCWRQETSRKGIIMNVARTFNNWRKYRQTVSELGRMSSRELEDLGINRADIQSVARQSLAR